MKKKSSKKKVKVFGYHFMLDLYECSAKAVRDMDNCYYFLEKITQLLKMKKQAPPFVMRGNDGGVVGWIPIVESGISVYAEPNLRFVSVDIYSCKKFSLTKVKEFTNRTFCSKKIKEKFILRGKEYLG